MALRVIHEPPAGTSAQVDFVAVHGLNFAGHANHGVSTWEADDKIWLRDFMPSRLELPCRVFLYEYNASPAIGSGAINLDDHAKKLLLLLDTKRKRGVSQRPIVFVCHSLGGILVKAALVEAKLDDSYQDILKATKLLVFFGTPHQGGNLASVGEYAAKLYKVLARTPNNDLVDALKASSNMATKRFEQFRHQIEDYLVISCFEGEQYSKATGIIVDKRSATMNLSGKREKQIPMERDHSSMCKFASVDEPDCELIIETIASQLEMALLRFQDVNRQELLDRLDYPNRRAREAQIWNVDNNESTFMWIWESPFAEWLASTSRIFWIRGKPASGKSTLMNYISHEPRTEQLVSQVFGASKAIIITFYFDFRQEKTTANTIKGMLLSIVHTLVGQISHLAANLRVAFPNWRAVYADGDWDMSALLNVTRHSLREIQQPVGLFVDGLDEFNGSPREQLDLAVFLAELPSLGDIKLCFASRPHDILRQRFGQGPLLDMQEWNRPGLCTYVYQTFDDIGLAPSRGQAAQVQHLSDLMAEMAEGVFTWVKFAVDDVINLWAQENLEFAILLLKLAQLPKDVESLWDERRDKLTDQNKILGATLLRIACSAARPLDINELIEVFNSTELDPELHFKPSSLADISRWIAHLSCGLLEIQEALPSRARFRSRLDCPRVLLVHKSVAKYLETRGWWLADREATTPESFWFRQCVSFIKKATYAEARSRCYRGEEHDTSNAVCKAHGCYTRYMRGGSSSGPQYVMVFPVPLLKELSGRITQAINSQSQTGRASYFDSVLKFVSGPPAITFVKTEWLSNRFLPNAFHWLAYYAWLMEARREEPCLKEMTRIMCPEVIMLMGAFRIGSCAWCAQSHVSTELVFHGAEDLLLAFKDRPPMHEPNLLLETAQNEYSIPRLAFTTEGASKLYVTPKAAPAIQPHEERQTTGATVNAVHTSALDATPVCLMHTNLDRLYTGSVLRGMSGRKQVKQRRIAIVGSRGSGKSSLTVRFVDGVYVESYYPTIENTFSEIIRYRGQDYMTEIVDAAGQDEFSILNSRHFTGVHGYIIVYTVKSRPSFDMVQIIRDKILSHLGATNVPIVVIGNDCEVEVPDRKVSVAEGKELGQQLGCPVIEASARYDINVGLGFQACIEEIEKGQVPDQAVTEKNCEVM